MAALIRRRRSQPSRLGRIHTGPQTRALRASGAQFDPQNPRDASIVTKYRQPWQEEALDYVETVGELRYAHKLLGNTTKKVRFLPGAYVPDSDAPVPVEDSDLATHAAAAHDALDRLGSVATIAELAAATIEAFKAPGEAFLVGRTDRGDGIEREVWEIRSISEVGTVDERVVLRDAPSSRSSLSGNRRDGEPLAPGDFIARLWTPSRRYRMLADSPVRAAIDTCLEALVLLGKEISATSSSRLVSAGLLMLDERLGLANDNATTDSLEDDPVTAALIASGTAAKRNPSSAEAAFPILLRGPAEAIKESKHLTFARPAADFAADRDWLLRRLATTLDLPSELLLGTPANHWTGWLVDDVKWRDHVEPGVQDVAESWTNAYFRPYLIAAGVPPEAAARMTIWYDPTRAVVKSDRTAAAGDAHERAEISGAAYREHLGFREDEAPDDTELLRRAAMKGLLDPAATLAILQGKEPPEPAPSQPAITPVDDVVDAEPIDEGPPNGGVPPEAPPADDLPDAAAMRRRVLAAQRRRPAIAAPAPLIAAGHISADEALAISQRLATIDTQLREKIRGSAEASVKRALERAGSRLVSKGRKDATVAAAVADIPAWAVPARLGPALVAAIDDVDEAGLLATVLGELESLWHRFVTAASDLALRQAARMVGMDVNEAFAVLDGRFRADRAAGWVFLSERLTDVARAALLMDPSEAIAAGRLVSPSVARAAIAVAGGFDTPTSRGINAETLLPVDRTEHFGGIGTGTTIKDFAEGRGAQVERLQWIHGFSERAFEPHLALDRKFFDNWDDQVLRAPEGADFMGSHMRPGDHKGCSCDMVLVWTPPPAREGDTR